MNRITTYLLIGFAVIFSTQVYGQLQASNNSLLSEEEILRQLNWVKAKIEKYGGKAGNEFAYQVSFKQSTCEFIVEQVSLSNDASQNFTFILKLKDFKEIRFNGPDLEILTNGTQVVGLLGTQKSAWSGIRIYRFREGESELIGRMQEAMQQLSRNAVSKCGN